MTSRREQVGAVFFAFIMVLSMVGGSIAFGGLAAADDSAVLDADGDTAIETNNVDETNETSDENTGDEPDDEAGADAGNDETADGDADGENATGADGNASENELNATATQSDQDDELLVPRDEDDDIYVGETVAVGFLANHTGDTYEWEVVDNDTGEVLNDHLLYNDTAEVDLTTGEGPPHAARVNSFRPTEPGEYEISVVVDGTDEHNETIEVTTAESDLPGDFSSRHELAQEYAPVLNFHPDEEFYPTRYEAYVQNSELVAPDAPFETEINASLVDIGADWTLHEGTLYDEITTTDSGNYLTPLTRGDDEHAEYQADVVEELYPETVYTSIHEDVSYEGETYTAVGYWMVYIHDPKPDGTNIALEGAAAHTGDQEPVFILVDENGDPQWVGAQQHFGGEIRPWDQVNKTDRHPTFWIAEGAHSNFFGPYVGDVDVDLTSDRSDELLHRYQSQFLRASYSLTSSIPPVDRLYDDPIAADTTWDSDQYEISLLSNQTAWGAYEGDAYRYPWKFDGDIPMQQDRWEDTSTYLNERLHEDHEQRNVTIVESDEGLTTPSYVGTVDGENKLGILLKNDRDTLEPEDAGMKADDYVVNLTATPHDGGDTVTKEYQVFIGTDDGQGEFYGTDTQYYNPVLPDEINSGYWDIYLDLSLYDADRLKNPDEETLSSATLENVDIDRGSVANIELVSEPSGVYHPGGDLDFDVEVENVDNDEQTFSIEYTLVGDGVQTDIDPASENVTLDSGESTTLSVDGTLADEMRGGTYNLFVSVGDDETRDEAFDNALSDESVVVPPEPAVEDISVETVTDDSVVVNATATNEGANAEWQSLAVSLPGMDDTTGIQLVDSDFDGVDETDDILFEPGDTVGSEYGQNETELEYPLLEASTTDWDIGEERSLLFELPAEQQGDIAYAKSVASADGEQLWTFEPEFDETTHVDQQQEFVYAFQLVEDDDRDEQTVSFDITDVDGQAGGIESPRPISVDAEIQANDEPYPVPVSGQMFDIEVGGESVETVVLVTRNSPGQYTLRFVPPSEDDGITDPGEYDLDIEFVDERFSIELTDDDARSDAVSYSEGETTQVAASLQIDRSGSMGGIMDEAQRGANAFVDAADENDYISLVSYSGSSDIDYPLKKQTPQNKSDLESEIDSLYPSGATNIGDAMTDGLLTIENAPEGAEKAGIHMTDGVQNTGPSEDEILNDIVPSYNDDDVCLYTIGFTSGADEEFMQDVANVSDCGTYRFAAESGEGDEAEATLQEVFSDIATDVSGDSVLYQQAGTVINTTQHQFQIDDTVAQTSLSVQLDDVDLSGAESLQELADEDGSTAMTATDSDDVPSVTVYDPDGNEIDPESDPDVERSVIGDTISFQIDDPDPGEWSYEIENPDDEELGYDAEVTGATQTTMDVSTAGDTYYVGSEADLTATLIGPNGVVEGATLEADVVGPNGNERTVTFTERSPGEYTSSVDVDEDGTYTAEVSAEAADLSRQKSVSWTVDADASFSVTQTTTTDIVPGSTDSISVELERDDTGIDDPRTVTVGLAELTRTDGSTVISASDIELSRQTFDLGPNESDVVTVSASVPDDTPSGVYEGNMRLFTDDGAVISDPVTVTVLEDATIELDITDLSDSVTAGETIEIDVVIENTGDVASTGTAELLIDGTLAHTSSVELGPSETEQVTLNYDTTDADVGEDVPVEVQTADMTETVMIEVIESSSEDSDTGGGTVVGPIDPVGTSVVDSMRQTVTDFNQNIEGTTVVLPDTALDSIGFIEDDLSGSLDVFELDETPEYAPPLDDDQPFITGFVVEVDDHLTNESATLTITVPSEQIENAGVDADELTVLYMSDDDYKRLETSVETDEDITVSAQTSGFSTFIITTSDRVDESDDDETVDESDDDETVDESDDDETVDEEDETVDEEDDEAVDESDEEDDEAVDESDEEDDEAVDESDEDTPGFGAVTALIALLAVTLLVTRRRMS